MNKKTIRDVDLNGKRVLMRVDFNVPMKDGKVSDDTRITETLPTIKYILDQGASIVMMSHRGKPKAGKFDAEFSLKPVADRLSEIINKPVLFAADCVGAETSTMINGMKAGELCLLENTRFYAEEEGKVKMPDGTPEEEIKTAKAAMKVKQEEFAKKLSAYGDIYVNDAFGSAHRAHASTAIVAKFYQERLAGFLMEKEIDYLDRALSNPERPFLAILGGAKVSDKINVIESLLPKVDSLIIGGAMAYTFYRAKGLPVGKSLVEEDRVDVAKNVLAKAAERQLKILLPIDNIIADSFSAEAKTEAVADSGIKDGWMALDIGPKSAELFAAEVSKAKTVVWNGPMGAFEMEPFASGTFAVAKALAATNCTSIVGGGDSVSAVKKMGVSKQITHISTGGGASLEFLEGKQLPGVVALSEKN